MPTFEAADAAPPPAPTGKMMAMVRMFHENDSTTAGNALMLQQQYQAWETDDEGRGTLGLSRGADDDCPSLSLDAVLLDDADDVNGDAGILGMDACSFEGATDGDETMESFLPLCFDAPPPPLAVKTAQTRAAAIAAVKIETDKLVASGQMSMTTDEGGSSPPPPPTITLPMSGQPLSLAGATVGMSSGGGKITSVSGSPVTSSSPSISNSGVEPTTPAGDGDSEAATIPSPGAASSSACRPSTSCISDQLCATSGTGASMTPLPPPSSADAARATRAAAMSRFHAKRARRSFAKKVMYAVRKDLADVRPRVKGRFVSRTHMALYKRYGDAYRDHLDEVGTVGVDDTAVTASVARQVIAGTAAGGQPPTAAVAAATAAAAAASAAAAAAAATPSDASATKNPRLAFPAVAVPSPA
ncbi:hypothetical protein MMPV_003283 [Pyropia vietnamensis]